MTTPQLYGIAFNLLLIGGLLVGWLWDELTHEVKK